MGSELAKVLHRVDGAPMVHYPIQAALDAGVEDVVVVVGHQAAAVEEAVRGAFPSARFAEQRVQRGTGHAVLCALPALSGEAGPVLILSGDVPLLRASTLRELVDAAAASSAGLALATFEPPEAVGYGRILRDRGRPVGIREERDASPEERAIRECNAGVYCADLGLLRETLPTLGTANAQGEIYLTDVVAAAAKRGEVAAVKVDPEEVAGINTQAQLAAIEGQLQRRAAAQAI
jgi:bifunctional UDP-N-acetylglucosamine pyrophosphorylase/glucosamine-1-phosphate N-acetyltransferase